MTHWWLTRRQNSLAAVHGILGLEPPVAEAEPYALEVLVRRFEWKGKPGRQPYESSATVGVLTVDKDVTVGELLDGVVQANPRTFPPAARRGRPYVVVTDERLRLARQLRAQYASDSEVGEPVAAGGAYDSDDSAEQPRPVQVRSPPHRPNCV